MIRHVQTDGLNSKHTCFGMAPNWMYEGSCVFLLRMKVEFNDACHALWPLANIRSDHLIMLLRKVEAVLKVDNNLIHYMLKDMFNICIYREKTNAFMVCLRASDI